MNKPVIRLLVAAAVVVVVVVVVDLHCRDRQTSISVFTPVPKLPRQEISVFRKQKQTDRSDNYRFENSNFGKKRTRLVSDSSNIFFFDSADFTFYSVSNDNDVKCDNWTLGRSSGCSRNTRLKTNTDDVDVERLPPSLSLSRLLTHFIHTFTATSGHPLSLSFIHALPLFHFPPPSLSLFLARPSSPSLFLCTSMFSDRPNIGIPAFRIDALKGRKHTSLSLPLSYSLSLTLALALARTRASKQRELKKRNSWPPPTHVSVSLPLSLSISPLSYSLSPFLFLSFTVILMPSLWSSMPLSLLLSSQSFSLFLLSSSSLLPLSSSSSFSFFCVRFRHRQPRDHPHRRCHRRVVVTLLWLHSNSFDRRSLNCNF